jgi:hypothetical protein
MLNTPPNYCNNLPKCGRTCTREASPPNKSVNFAEKKKINMVTPFMLCHFLAAISLQPLRDGLFEGSVEGFY